MRSLTALSIAVVALLVLGKPGVARAQAFVTIGAQARVTTSDSVNRRIEGRLLRLWTDSIAIRRPRVHASADTLVIARSSVTSVELRGPRQREQGVAWGALAGLGFGVLAVVASCGGQACDGFAILVPLPMALYGAAIGALIAPPRWLPARLPP